jgi:hypothetical protein
VPVPALQPAPAPSDDVAFSDARPVGIAGGRWEAPAWAFYVVAAAALLGVLAWIAVALRTRTARTPRGSIPPRSSIPPSRRRFR